MDYRVSTSIAPSCTTTAPIGTSPASADFRASASAALIASRSEIMPKYYGKSRAPQSHSKVTKPYGLISIGVPSATARHISSMSALVKAMQPSVQSPRC